MASLFGALGKSLEDWAYNTFYSDTQKKNDAAVKASNQQAQAHAQMKAGQINPVQYKRQAAIAANSITPAYSAPNPQQQGYAPQAPSRLQIQAPRISDIPRPQLNPTQQFDKIIQPKPTIKPPVPQNNSSVGSLGGVAHDMFYGSQKRDLEKSQNATNMQAEAHKAYKEGKISKQQYGSILRQAADSANNTTARSRIAPELKKGLSYKDIAQNSGYSTEEVKDYVKKYNPSYGDRGLAMNAIGGVKDFGVNMVKGGAGIVTKPIHEATANRAADNDKLKQINADFKAGNITGAAAMERAQAIADPYINKKVNVSDDGTIGVGSGNALDFLGKFTMQGVDTAGVLPVGGAFAKGAGVGLQQVGKSVAGPTLSTALTRTGNMANAVGNNLMQTTINQTSSKLAEQLATRGMNIDKARIIGNALTNNAKEAGIYGTLQTGSDIAQGNFTPEGALMNYGGQFALGAGGELGLGGTGALIGKGLKSVPTPEKLTMAHPEIQGLETTAKQYFDHRNSLIDRGLSPNSTAVRAVDNAIRKLGKEYDKTYKRVYEAQTQGGYAKLPFREAGEADISPTAKSYSAESTPDSIIKDTSDYWYKHGKDTKGGQMIDTTGELDAYGSGIKRISEHNQFYSDFYKANKRAPSKADYQAEISDQLEKGGGSMVDPDMATAYQLAKTRQAEIDALLANAQDTTDYSMVFDAQKNGGLSVKQSNTPVQVRSKSGQKLRSSQETLSRSSQQSGQKTPSPDSKARTGQTYTDNTPQAPYSKESLNRIQRANQSRNGKLTISEEKRIAELQNEPKITETEPNPTQPAPQKSVRLDRATDDGKSLAGFLEKSHENLPENTTVTIKYQPSGTQDLITVQGKVKTSYGGRIRNDKYTSTMGGKTTEYNNYSAEGRTIVTDSNGNNHLINNMDMKSVETHDPNLTAGLTPMEKQFARMNGISEVDFARQKAATASKPTLQDALAGKSAKIKDQTTSTPVAKTPVETSQSQVSKTTQTPQAVAPEQSASVSSPTNVLQKEATQKTRGKTGLIKQESQELSRTYPDNTTKQVKKRGFIETVKGSDEVSSEVRKKVSGEYNVRSTDKLAVSADKFAKGNLNKISDDVNSRLDKKLGTINDQDVADALAVAKRLDGQSRFNESQAIYDKLAEHGTKGGQTIQAFSLLRNRTPEGVKFQMLKNLKKAGVVLTKDDQKQVSKLIDNVRKTKVGTESRDRALYETLDFVSRRIPTSNPDKLVNFWRAGLLTAPKTTAGNLLGNSTELATQKFWSDPIAVGTDKFFSMFTGKRTKTYGTGTVSGVKEGVVKGADYLKTGFDVRNMPNAKYDAPRRVNYKNKLLDTYVNGVYRWMGAQDQPFYYAAKASAAHDLAKADGINLKLKGEELANYIEKSVANPEWKPQTFKTAKDVTDYAKYAVYQNETMLGSMASGLKQGADKFKGGRAITDFILPFTQVPSSIAMRIIDRTPVGIARTVVSQIKNKTFDQRAMAEAIGNGSFGIPVIAAGYALANSGNITGAYPSDEKERKLWEAEGKQAYSVKVGDRWYSLNYMQPFGTLMSIGKQVSDDKKDGKSDAEAWMNATGAAAKSIESQSFLKGLNGVLSAINDPERSMGQFVKSTASSVVPNFIRAGATATDSMQRETKTPLDAFMGAVPGVRQTLPTKLDMFGADLKAKDNAVNQFVNPLSPSKVKGHDDSVLQELRRLQDAKEGIVTTTFDKTSIGGAELTPDQVRNLNQLVNTEVKDKWSKVMQDQRYKDMSDSEKSAALKRAKENIAESVKKQFVFDNKITTTSTYKDKANKSVFTGSKGGDSGETYQEKYDYAVDDFKKNSGSLSPIERAKKQKNIAYLSVQKDYDKDTVSLYGMGESDIYGLLDNLPEKESSQYFNMILKYGDALVEKGLLKTNKLRDRYGNVQYARGSGGKVSYTTGGRSSGGRRTSSRSTGGGSGGRSAGDVTSGKALLALQTGLNKIKTPRTTGKTPMPKSSVPVPPSFNKKNLRKFAVKGATLTVKKARA